MNKFINDNIGWVILLCVGLAVAAFVLAIGNRKKLASTNNQVPVTTEQTNTETETTE